MALADVYDALISKRAYKPAYPHQLACDIIRQGHDSHFGPEIVAAFDCISDDFLAIATRFADEEAELPP
jgi:putative two-component system response regulator